MADYTNVGKVSDFADGAIKGFEVNGDKVAVVNTGGRWYAFTNSCSHLGIPLTAGVIHNQSVVCVFHNSYFSMTTGAIEHGPAYDPLKIYEVQIEGEDVLVGSADS